MTCYEHLRKKNNQDKETFNKLHSYFRALENNKLDEYHDYRDKFRKSKQRKII
jgi:hypothetical protein